MTRTITVEIVADTRQFRRSLTQAELLVARSPWRRLMLRIACWRISREGAP